MKKIMVVAPGPAYSVADVYDGLVKGLRAQPDVEVATINLDARVAFYCNAHIETPDGEFIPAFSNDDGLRMAAKSIEQHLYEYWPDIVVIVSGFFIPPEMWGILARRPHHVVLWCTESPYEDDKQAQPARYVDTVVLNDPTNIETFRRTINERTFYLPHSYDPVKHHPGPADPRLACDFAFVGTGFQSRIDFLEQVNWDGINVKLGGNWQELADDSPLLPFLVDGREKCMSNGDAAALYRAAKVTANLYRKETTEEGTAHGWAIGPREVELAACGSFFLRDPRPEGDHLFPMLPTFTTPQEFERELRWFLANPQARESAATLAREAIAHRTFDRTAATLLRLLEGAPTIVR